MTTQKSMPLPVFIKLTKRHSVQELRQMFPAEAFPDVPEHLQERLPLDVQQLLSDIAVDRSAGAISSYLQFEEEMGKEVADALTLLDKPSEVSTQSKQFFKCYQDLRHLYDSFDRDNSIHVSSLVQQVHKTEPFLTEVRLDTQQTFKAHDTLREALTKHPHHAGHIEQAITHVMTIIRSLEELLNGYYVLRLKVVSTDLRNYREKISGSMMQLEQVSDEILSLKAQVKNEKGFLFKRQAPLPQDERRRLIKRLNQLKEQRRELEVFIDEQRLISWLDMIVDVDLISGNKQDIESISRYARMALFHLLQCFCKLQEQYAEEVVKNKHIIDNPEDAVHYYLSSEKFVLNYFMRKRNSLTKWMGCLAQQKLEHVENLQDIYISELKSSFRLRFSST